MKVQYFEDGDLAVFNGRSYRRDKKTGYFLNSTIRKRLHRAVWEYHYGEIPEGSHIHHVDGDKSNNEIENLEMLSAHDHVTYHGLRRADLHYEEMVQNLNENARPKAAEWHHSEEGKRWHSQHAIEVAANLAEKDFVCACCGQTFSRKPMGPIKFCSNACKSAYRRKAGVDNEVRRCVFCGKTFVVNKYSKTSVCSRSCSMSLRWRKKNSQSGDGGCVQHGGRKVS